MESYSEELRTPPLALVALLGRSDLHATISDFLRKEQRPPINSIGVPELSRAVSFFGEHKEKKSDSQAVRNILHRLHSP